MFIKVYELHSLKKFVSAFCAKTMNMINVTGFVNINPNHKGTEIQFIGKHYSLALALTRNA